LGRDLKASGFLQAGRGSEASGAGPAHSLALVGPRSGREERERNSTQSEVTDTPA